MYFVVVVLVWLSCVGFFSCSVFFARQVMSKLAFCFPEEQV